MIPDHRHGCLRLISSLVTLQITTSYQPHYIVLSCLSDSRYTVINVHMDMVISCWIDMLSSLFLLKHFLLLVFISICPSKPEESNENTWKEWWFFHVISLFDLVGNHLLQKLNSLGVVTRMGLRWYICKGRKGISLFMWLISINRWTCWSLRPQVVKFFLNMLSFLST